MNFRTIANTAKLIAFIAVISLASCKKDGQLPIQMKAMLRI